MTNEVFAKKLSSLKEARDSNLSKLGEFAKALQAKVDGLWERRKTILEQLPQIFELENAPLDSLNFMDGGTEGKISFVCGDLRDKRDRSRVTVELSNIHTRSTSIGETDRNQEKFVVGDLIDIAGANKVAEEVRKLEEFVDIGENVINLYFNRAMRIEADQKKMLDNIIDPPEDADGYW